MQSNARSLAFGNSRPVINSITFEVSGPETLIIATPDIPGPEDKAKIVIGNITYLYIFFKLEKKPSENFFLS